MAIKKTLLEIVQEILSAMDSEAVNSLSDSEEANQVADIVESTFYNIISTRDIAYHERLLRITAVSDSDYPTSFQLLDSVKSITKVWYNVETVAAPSFRDLTFLEPTDFINRLDGVTEDYVVVNEPVTGAPLKVRTNAHPQFWTSFDDDYIIMDSYDNTVDTTLRNSKIRALGSVFPVFSKTDDYTPELAPQYFPYLINEAKSVAFDVLKGGTTPKVDQAARRQKAYIQNDKYRNRREPNWSNYGRS